MPLFYPLSVMLPSTNKQTARVGIRVFVENSWMGLGQNEIEKAA